MPFRPGLAAFLIALGAALPALAQVETRPPEVPTEKPAFAGQTRAPTARSNVAYRITPLASGLSHPWGLAWIDDRTLLVSERSGRLRTLTTDGKLGAPIAGTPQVTAIGQGGLLDVAVSPGFAGDRTIFYSYFARNPSDGLRRLTAASARLSPDRTSLSGQKVIFTAEPGDDGALNIGGRLTFARDRTLFISVGDRFELMDDAQRLDNDLGKIVRINPDGSVPRDNPFVGKAGARPEIWSYGHRNPEGLALSPFDGRIWEVEHGPRGGDEINRPDPGKNYGWPTITYGKDYDGRPIKNGITAKAGLEQPLYYWDPVIAPSGLIVYSGRMFPAWKGDLLIGSLKLGHVARLAMNGTRVTGEERLFVGEIGGRIRDIVEGADGALYIVTDADNGKVVKVTAK